MKPPQAQLGEALITFVILAVYLTALDGVWGNTFVFLPVAVGGGAILLPTYLVFLLIWRHHFGPRPSKDRNSLDEL